MRTAQGGPGINLQTSKLPIPKSGFKLINPLTGSLENAVEALAFYFPRLAASAGILVAANFSGAIASSLIQADPDEEPDMTKSYGTTLYTPKYGSIEFGNTDLQNQKGNQYTGIDGKIYTFPNILLPIAIISVTQPTNIVKTKITGRPGAIKEYIGADDKNITINAVINMPGDQAPTEFLEALQQMKDAAVPIPVTNYFLNALDINYIVIEDISTPQEEGGYSNQALTISACSDIPLQDFLP